jgi:hypothetical protein
MLGGEISRVSQGRDLTSRADGTVAATASLFLGQATAQSAQAKPPVESIPTEQLPFDRQRLLRLTDNPAFLFELRLIDLPTSEAFL